MWIGGEGGVTHFWNGTSWTLHALSTRATVTALDGVNADDMWAGTAAGELFHWTGQGWLSVATPITGYTVRLHALRSNAVWLLTDRKAAFWNGTSWVDRSSGLQTYGLFDLWAASDSQAFVVGGTYLAEWTGTSWTTRSSPPVQLSRISGTSASDVWVVGSAGTLLHRVGTQWQSVPVPPSTLHGWELVDVQAFSPTSVVFWLSSGQQTEQLTLDSQGQLVRVSGLNVQLRSRWCGSPTSCFAGGAGLAVSDVAGWHAIETFGGSPLMNMTWQATTAVGNEVWFSDANRLVRYGRSGWREDPASPAWPSYVSRFWVDSGGNEGWLILSSSVYHWVRGQPLSSSSVDALALAGSGVDNVWAVGTAGSAWRYRNGFWSPTTTGTSEYLRAVWTDGTGNAWAAGFGGTLVHWDGLAWTKLQTSTTNSLIAIDGVGSEVWIGGERGTVLRWDGTALQSLPIATYEQVESVAVVSASEVYVSTSIGQAFRWNGAKWVQLRLPAVRKVVRVDGDVYALGDRQLIARLGAGGSCQRAEVLSSPDLRSYDLTLFGNANSGARNGCPLGVGSDVTLAVDVPPSQSISFTVVPEKFDVSLALVADEASCASRMCALSTNLAGPGGSERVAWNNTTSTTQRMRLIIDSGPDAGIAHVLPTIGAIVPCSATTCPQGCCLAGVCVDGSADSHCGAPASQCSVCGNFQSCEQGSCVDVPRTTGETCTASAQCDAWLSTARCVTSWPQGYCSSSCLSDIQCAGVSDGSSVCVSNGPLSGDCLSTCASPGAGRSTCRSDYRCVGVSSGSQSVGVCKPSCAQVPCASGTCQPSGYCQ